MNCVLARQAGCCNKKLECRRDAPLIRVVEPAECASCRDRREKLSLSVVLPAFNEGDEVRQTIESFNASALGQIDLEIVVVDDGSEDGSCDNLDYPNVRVVRHKKPWGVGRSRNHGIAESGGDVVAWFDAHMRVHKGSFFPLTQKAYLDRAIVHGVTTTIKWQKKPHWYGCDIFFNHKDGFQPKWRSEKPAQPWWRVPCPMGASYFVSRRTIEEMSVTGQFWEDTAGRWGFSEQALAVKAFLMDVPVLVHRETVFAHRFRNSNPVPTAGADTWMNVARAMYALTGPDEFEKRWRPMVAMHLRGDAVIDESIAGIEPPPWHEKADYSRIYTHLCGRHANILRAHPDHEWIGGLRKTCRELAKRAPGGKGLRVWQWRPGESTLLMRRWLPEAEIHACEYMGHRSATWHPILLANGVQSYVVPLHEAYVLAPTQVGGEFDLVIVGGEKQTRCQDVAAKILTENGQITLESNAGRAVIEQDEVKKERQMLKETEAAVEIPRLGPVLQPPASSPVQPPQSVGRGGGPPILQRPNGADSPLVTVLLMNYQRPQNLPRILRSLESQTVPIQFYVWDNSGQGGSLLEMLHQHPLTAMYVRSHPNMRCWPRWLLASMADTEFVCTLDDDLMLADSKVLGDAADACRTRCPEGVVGFFGWKGIEGEGYKAGKQHVNGSGEDRWVDFIKGRFMFLRTKLLERVTLRHPALKTAAELIERADDFYVNLCISRGRRGAHLVPGVLGKRWVDLPQHGGALAGQKGHYTKRGELIERMFKHYAADDSHSGDGLGAPASDGADAVLAGASQ